MTITIIRTGLIALAGLFLAFAGPAHADWRRAESPNFIVYSQGPERALRRYVRNLEIYDFFLRARMGLPASTAGRKLPIYLVNGRSGLLEINPATGDNVAGTYFPTGEDIFAVAIDDREQDYLFHEYFHHFSHQIEATAGYPAWLVEGLAEYFMTAEISATTVKIGGFNEGRVYGLFTANWLPLDDLVSKRFAEVSPTQRVNYYPLAWLLTHWFMSDDARREQLSAYVRDLHQGADSVPAMEKATGMTMEEIRQQLRRYRRLMVNHYTAEFPETPITITQLPPSADDLLLISQRLKVGVAEDERAGTAELVRRLAARHPEDPFALLQLGHAELHFGDPEVGEAILERLLEREPENVEALQLMASRYMRLAEDRPAEVLPLMRRARTYLGRAYEADPAQYRTLHLLAQTRQVEADYPTENDLLMWDLAFRLAPQLASIRLGFASALMSAEEFDEAVIILRPLANAAHGGAAAEMAASLMERARRRQASPSAADVEAAVDEERAGDGKEEDAPAAG
ncbi:MAG TPA: tetratricopeptide repeat protein [Brevundimonas sp.]|nr:tetratricopeptide repeat protein [Brevundimonas sp.]